jgi:hypothetical protein
VAEHDPLGVARGPAGVHDDGAVAVGGGVATAGVLAA